MEEAAASYQALLAEDPDEPEVLRQLAEIHAAGGRPEAALPVLRLAAALEPRHALTWCMLGSSLAWLGEHDAAGEAYERALSLAPESSVVRWNRALWLLLEGRWAEGWAEYEWGAVHGSRRVRHVRPQWDGRKATSPDERLFVWAEQGMGDTLQFSRFLAPAADRWGGKVVLEAQRELVPLLVAQGWPVEVIAQQLDGSMPGGWSEHVALMSLPRVLGLERPDDVPPPLRWVRDTPKSENENQKLRVGLVWRGNPQHPGNRLRSLEPEWLSPLAEVAGVEWVSLQLGAEPPAWTGAAPLLARHWQETAAVVEGLDLAIGCDTGVMHLAASMGIPTWWMLSRAPDFRWGRVRTDCPWYPGALLFRQAWLGDWDAVVRRVGMGLAEAARLQAQGGSDAA